MRVLMISSQLLRLLDPAPTRRHLLLLRQPGDTIRVGPRDRALGVIWEVILVAVLLTL